SWGRHDYSVLRALKREGRVRLAAVLQDMIPHVHPQFFETGPFIDRFEAYVRFLATDTDLVLLIPNCTREDFLKAAPTVDTGKVTVVHLGADLGVPAEPRRPAELDDL